MERHILLVHSNPAPGQEDAYNSWYTDQHLAEVIDVPGFVAAHRLRMSPELRYPDSKVHPYGYLAYYEIEGMTPREAWNSLEATKANRIIPATMHPDRLSAIFTPIASLRR
ncbi:MAG TPA: hypothetical protein VGH89_42395 [Pseudonocardia sp.]|jgi:hypothetical protein